MSASPSLPQPEPTPPSSISDIIPPHGSLRRPFVMRATALLLCLGVALVALTVGRGLLYQSTEPAASQADRLAESTTSTLATPAERVLITSLIDRFLHAMTQRDITTAYDSFSSRLQQQMPMTTLTQQRNIQPYLFDGYQAVTLDALDITTTAETNPAGPQGNVASVLATITYTDGSTGSLRAKLEQEHGTWRMFFYIVVVSGEKIKPTP